MRKILDNARISLIANISSNVLSFSAILILARSMSVEQYALFATFLTTALIAIQAMDLGFSVSLINNKVRLDKLGVFSQAVIAVLFMRLLFCIGVSGLVFFIGPNFEEGLFKGFFNPLHFLFITAFTNTLVLMYQVDFKYIKYAKVLVGVQFARLIFVMLGLLFLNRNDALGFIMYTYMLAGVAVIPFFYVDMRKIIINFNFNYLSLLRGSLWPYVSLLASAIVVRLDIYILPLFTTMDQVGRYAAYLNVALLIPVLFNAIYPLVLSSLRDIYEKYGVIKTLKKIYLYVLFVSPCLIFLAYICDPIPVLIFGDSYALPENIFGLMFLIYVLGIFANIVATSIYYVDTSYILTMSIILQLILHVVLSFVLIPRFGVMGAVLAALGGRLFSLLIIVISSGVLGVRHDRSTCSKN